MQAVRVDAPRAPGHDCDAGGGAQHEWVQLLPAGLGVLLRVVEPGEGPARGERQPVEVEEDRGRHERPGERASAGFVGASDEAALERPIEGEELAAASLRAGTRAFRSGLGASR